MLESSTERAQLILRDGQLVELGLEQVAWARPFLDEDRRGPAPRAVDAVLSVGDVVRVELDAEGAYQLSQVPKAQGPWPRSMPNPARSVRWLAGSASP